MCVKLLLKDLNTGPCLSHPTSTYIYGVTIAPTVCGGNLSLFLKHKKWGQNHKLTKIENKKST